MDKDNKTKNKREGEQEAVNYSMSFMEELESEQEVQMMLIKQNEKMFAEKLKKEHEEILEENQKIILKNQGILRKTAMLQYNFAKVQAFYEQRWIEGPPQ